MQHSHKVYVGNKVGSRNRNAKVCNTHIKVYVGNKVGSRNRNVKGCNTHTRYM